MVHFCALVIKKILISYICPSTRFCKLYRPISVLYSIILNKEITYTPDNFWYVIIMLELCFFALDTVIALYHHPFVLPSIEPLISCVFIPIFVYLSRIGFVTRLILAELLTEEIFPTLSCQRSAPTWYRHPSWHISRRSSCFRPVNLTSCHFAPVRVQRTKVISISAIKDPKIHHIQPFRYISVTIFVVAKYWNEHFSSKMLGSENLTGVSTSKVLSCKIQTCFTYSSWAGWLTSKNRIAFGVGV